MATLFLILIYITFIGLGLPDSMLGAGWPVMYLDFGVDVGLAGILTILISGGTVVSSLLSERMLARFGTGKVVFTSVLATAVALWGFFAAPGFVWLVLFAIPLGLGGGAVDAALNNYIALHYKPRHMSWLHCFWGLGALLGPLVMSGFLQKGGNWRGGYMSVAVLQSVIVALLLLSLRMWKDDASSGTDNGAAEAAPSGSIFAVKGVKPALMTFFFYCSLEHSMGNWGATFLVRERGLDPAVGARFVSTFYIGITAGRLLTGFLTMRIGNKALIRLGQWAMVVGAGLLFIPASPTLALAGLSLIGLGCAPVFPCMLHETPVRFGRGASQKLMGMQMAFGYIGATAMPAVLGALGSRIGFWVMPVLFAAYAGLMLLCTERVNGVVKE